MSDYGRINMPDNGAAEGGIDELHGCRLCGQVQRPVYYIYTNNDPNLAEKIRYFSTNPLSPDDPYSDFLCVSCADEVNMAFEIMKAEQRRQLERMHTLFTVVPEDAAEKNSTPSPKSPSSSSSSWCSCSNPTSPSSSSSGEEGEDNQ